MLAKFAKPAGCESCQLHETGTGFIPPTGPYSPLVFIGESGGYNEAMLGECFVGPAGAMLDRIFRRSSIAREQVRIANCVSCRPPGDWLDGAPWQHAALTSCRQYLQPVLENEHVRVVVTLGSIPLKSVLDLWGTDGVRVQDFHGTVHRDPSDRFWVVPSFHPSHLQRGAINLLDVVRFDLGVAQAILRTGTFVRRSVSLLLDPPVPEFAAWVVGFLRALAADPFGVYLDTDIETPDKSGGRDEGELTTEDQSTTILRVNFAYRADEGVTVPYLGPYIPLIHQLLASGATLRMWNKGYDEPRLRLAGHDIPGEVWDLMWLAKHLQSDLPLGLGFWAPFYSQFGAWKHLGKQKGKEAEYAAIDALQTHRVSDGLITDAMKEGLWDTFYRHTHLREQYVLRPAHLQGCPISEPRLDAFHEKLQRVSAEKLAKINESSLTGTYKPKEGYRKRPKGNPCPRCQGVEGLVYPITDAMFGSIVPEKHTEGTTYHCALCLSWGYVLPVPPTSVIGKSGTKGDQAKQEYMSTGTVLVQREVEVAVKICGSCEKHGVGPAHNCLAHRKTRKGKQGDSHGEVDRDQQGDVDHTQQPPPNVPEIRTELQRELRWFWKLPFNPDASQQILRFIKDSGETPGRQKKTKKETGDKATLKKLAKKTGNPVYQDLLDYKAVKKVDSTYALGAKKRIWKSDGRIHPLITFRPSMGRDSCVNPNLQNVVGDKEGKHTLAAGFRNCITADAGYRLVEIDYCVDPSTKVLLDDLTWVRADALVPGDGLVAFDEKLGVQNKFRAGVVENVKRLIRPRIRVTTPRGTIIVSAEHRFAIKKVYKGGAGNRKWIEAQHLQVGDRISYLCDPWEIDQSREAGYLAGFFDGEGWVSQTALGYAQNVGTTLTYVQSLIANRGFKFYVPESTSSTAHCEITHGIGESLRFLGSIRPPRLLAKHRQIWEGRRTWGKRTPVVCVTGVEKLPDGEVIAVKSTTGTLITEGYFSHNCGIEGINTGWISGDPKYIRLATLGVHAYLTSYLLADSGKISAPAELSWSDEDLSLFFADIKKRFPFDYDKAKRCVTGDHQVLTPTGWVRLDQYQDGTSVAQWTKERILEFVPASLTKIPFKGELTFLAGRSLSAVMTPDHRVPLWRADKSIAVHRAGKLPTQGRIPCSGTLEIRGAEHVDHDFLRVVVAVQADGTIGRSGIVFHLHKERKITRLCHLLTTLGIVHTDVPCGHGTGRRIRISAGDADQLLAWLEGTEKLFHLPAFLRLSVACREAVVAELQYWDGHTRPGKGYIYFTSLRSQAERVQTLAASIDRQALLREIPRTSGHGRLPQYRVTFNTRHDARIEACERTLIAHDGFVYCLTVPSSFFLIKHRDRISVTGNCVHGNNYGLTPYGMVENFPDVYENLKAAEKVQDLYYALCPKLPDFHMRMRDYAYEHETLGGPYVDDYTLLTRGGNHPFAYRHKFFGVQSYRPLNQTQYRKLQWIAQKKMRREKHPRVRIINNRPFEVVLGEDSKRVIAFMPQSIAAGTLKEAELALFHPDSPTYIGEVAEGKTPLIAPIHDSLLLHVPDHMHEWVISLAIEVMRRPIPTMPCPVEWNIGSHIRVNVAVKVGPVGGSWENVETIKIPNMAPATAMEGMYMPMGENADQEWDDFQDLETRVS